MATKRAATGSPEPSASTSAARLYPSASPASPHKRLRRGEPGYDEEQAAASPEKRLKLFKKACPQPTRERANRVFSQRFFCVERRRTGETSEEFKVLGSTGNRYTVHIDKIPSCDCPDSLKGNKCKHQLFVLLKILQVPQSSNLWYQSALLTSELIAIFANARPAPQTAFETQIATTYKIATGALKPEEAKASSSVGGIVKKRVPEEGDNCPICYEEFEAGSEKGLAFCLSTTGCGNALHAECFRNWALTCKPPTCPLCRQKWETPATATGNPQAGPSFSPEGYANFAAMAGISDKRDTSSYYQGRRRGRGGRWRYDYDDDLYDECPY